MAGQLAFCLLLIALCCCCSLPFTIAQEEMEMCPDPDNVFSREPMSMTVDPGQNINFSCILTEVLQMGAGNFPGWEYMVINDTQFRTVNPAAPESIEKGFTLDNGRELFLINNVQAMHSGSYRCLASLLFCNSESFISDFVLRVTGKPTINLNNDTVMVETLSDLELNGTIAGFPEPSVEIFREIDGELVLLDQSAIPRFSFTFDDLTARLTIRIQGILRRDMGRYRIIANNVHGFDDADFIVMPKGPDPPILSLQPSEVVSQFGQAVSATCSIQADAFEDSQEVSIVWTDKQGVRVSATTTNPVFSSNMGDGSVVLNIRSLNASLVGPYTCTANNSRDSKSGVLQVFGPPPPPPASPMVMQMGDDILITWTPPNSVDVEVTQYVVEVYTAGTDVIFNTGTVNATLTSYTLSTSEWPAGDYEVAVASFSGRVRGEPTGRASFVVDSEDGQSALIVPIVAAVAGCVIFLIVLVVVIVMVYCYCSISARRSKNTHQQRWGSEENKLNQQPAVPAVQNTYTALSLHDSSELPPSPLSPMPSAIGIDPKWEFPRENIQLSDVLAEGQFTVLYKGIARNLKEKPCEVAVKSLKDDATEDDLKALIYEMDLLSSIEEHPSIVSLVRVCSVGKPLYMVMEYMCHGDLLGFLRACRGHHGMYTISPGNRYQPPSLQLCSRDLLNMATKIASGMRYLADRKIVHRALCTRNVLVGSGMDVKIYNVGSFDVTLDSRDGGMTKWMAPETLYDGTNTTYSDVWSFGITLWELVTVGGIPYGDILPEDLYSQLQSGMRIPCPAHCAQEVYNIMSACWQKNPTDRPHFAIIHENLDELVMSKMNYLDLRSYDGNAYSQFGDEATQLSTAL